MSIGIPEGIYLAIVAINTVGAAVTQPPRKFNAALIGQSITLGLLFWGGFFS